MEIHDNNVIPKIILFIQKYIGNEYQLWKDLLIIILLHQSIPIQIYKSVTPIEDLFNEVDLYFTKRNLELLGIFWINDSLSYNDDKIVIR